jgi:hypothetical protein
VPRGNTAPSSNLARPGEIELERSHGDIHRRVWFADATQPGAVRLIEQTPQSFVTRIDTWPSAAAPDNRQDKRHLVHVIVSRRALPGWGARADGKPLRLGATVDKRLITAVPRGVPLDVEWKYTPPGMTAGATISALLAAALIVTTLRNRSEA